jgi:hypothetical protein
MHTCLSSEAGNGTVRKKKPLRPPCFSHTGNSELGNFENNSPFQGPSGELLKHPYFFPLEPGKRNILLEQVSGLSSEKFFLSFLQGVDEWPHDLLSENCPLCSSCSSL